MALSRRAALAAVVLVGIVVLNVVAERSGRTADLTEGNRLTLTSETRGILRRVDQRLTIEGFVRADGPTGRDVAGLLDRYHHANHHIDAEVVDPDAEPGRARRLGVTQFGTAVLRYRQRRVDISTITEVELTSAVLRLVRGKVPTTCFVTGHGEPALDDDGPDGFSSFAALARSNGFVPTARNIGVAGLEGCDLVVLAGPRVPLAPAEVSALRSFLDADGKLFVLTDAFSEADVNPVIQGWGISFLGGVLLDRSSNFDNDPSTAVVTDFPSANQVVEGVPSLLAPAAAGLAVPDPQPRPGLTVSVLARSSGDSVLAADPEQPERGGIAGPVAVAAAADLSRVSGDPPAVHRTRLLVVADVALAGNTTVQALGNAKLLANGLSWLARDEVLLTVGASTPGAHPLTTDVARRRTAFVVTVLVVPLGLLLTGTLAVWRRRRR
ncbi:MAG: conserved rane protein of unknown function [Actinomycetia bacterium]|nr:conserved rane protein of unknown function [Actinomycetes bacterium]